MARRTEPDQARHAGGVQAINEHVGRLLAGLSQDKLGSALGITVQQVQNYERGTTRIAAYRLVRIAETLDMPVSFFFEGVPIEPRREEWPLENRARRSPLLDDQLALRLIQAFTQIESATQRRSIVDVVEAVGAEQIHAPPAD